LDKEHGWTFLFLPSAPKALCKQIGLLFKEWIVSALMTPMEKIDQNETLLLESFDREALERASAGLLWEELQVGEYHVWLRGGRRYEMNWAYGFQCQPRDRAHGPLRGSIFEQESSKVIGDFDVVKALALEAVRIDGLKVLLNVNSNRP
jgi:hypothetical protein